MNLPQAGPTFTVIHVDNIKGTRRKVVGVAVVVLVVVVMVEVM